MLIKCRYQVVGVFTGLHFTGSVAMLLVTQHAHHYLFVWSGHCASN